MDEMTESFSEASSAPASDLTDTAAPAEGSGFSSADPGAEVSTPASDTPAANGETDTAEEAQLPFHTHPRWQEVQQQKKVLEQELEQRRTWDPVIEGFKQQGLTNAESVRAAVVQRDQQANQQATLAQEAQRLQASIAAGELGEDAGEAHFQAFQERMEKEAMRAQLNSLTQTQHVIVLQQNIPALQKQFPYMEADEVLEAAKHNPQIPGEALAKASHDRAMQVIARYNASQAKRPATPVEGTGGGPAPTSRSIDQMSREEFDQYFNAQVAAAERAAR